MGATETVTVPAARNGPRDSGQGGYSAGALARHVAAPAVEVRLWRPVPLDVPLAVGREQAAAGAARDRGGVRLLAPDGGIVADARAARPDALALAPPPVAAAEARAAMGRYRGPDDGPLCECYVCGRRRADGLGVFAGAVAGRDGVVAATWTPAPATAGADGAVRAEHVWAVLDCPTYFAAYRDAPDPLPLALLGRFAVRIDAPVAVGREHVVVAWPLAVDGRKRDAAAAVLGPDGAPLALGRALLVEPRRSAG